MNDIMFSSSEERNEENIIIPNKNIEKKQIMQREERFNG